MTAVRFRFRPLRWTGPITPDEERRSPWTFKASYQDTIGRLDYELLSLGADEAVIEADFREQDIRQDGLPRSNARKPGHPGVRVAFMSRFGPLVYATDRHARWDHNLRAIALALEALRAVDRYGVSGHGEQYTGWKAIAAPEPVDAYRAALVRIHELAGINGVPTTRPTPGDIDFVYRMAARRCHPDTGGSTALFQELQDVIRVLRETTQEGTP